VFAAAMVTFVVSASIALSLNLRHDTPVERLDGVSAAAAPHEALPRPNPRPEVRFPDAAKVLAKTMIVAAPPAPPPVVAPPPAQVAAPPAPPPVAAPPAPPPVYVPPVPPQPRLRDRILERIPIIGRFHDP
jgi:hypothetical protein